MSCLEEIVGSENVAVLEGRTSEGHQLHELLRPGTNRFYNIAVAQDIDAPSWSQEMIQKICSGERVSVNPKGRDPVVGVGPKLICVTNGSLRMSDSGGQISRRLFCELFPYRLDERGIRPNPSFQRKICSPQEGGELANILINSLKYYFDMVKATGKEKDQWSFFQSQGLGEIYIRNGISMIGSCTVDKRGEEKGLRYLTDFFDALLEGRTVRPNDSTTFPDLQLKMSLGRRGVSMPKNTLLSIISEYIAMRSQKTYLLEELSHSELNNVLSTYRVKIGEKRSFTYVTESGGEAYLDDFCVEGISLFNDIGTDIYSSVNTNVPLSSPALSPLSLAPSTPSMVPPVGSQGGGGLKDADIISRLVVVVIREDEQPKVFTVTQDSWFSTPSIEFARSFKAAPILSPLGGSFHSELKRHMLSNDLFDSDEDVVDDLGLSAITKIIA